MAYLLEEVCGARDEATGLADGQQAAERLATMEGVMKSPKLFCLILALVVASTVSPVGGAMLSSEVPPELQYSEIEEGYESSPAAVVGAFAINLVYVPVRFAVTVVGALLGGIEGLISAGNEDAAETIWSLSDGSQVITPAMLEGRQPWTFSGRGW
jgi:hypothetical protein